MFTVDVKQQYNNNNNNNKYDNILDKFEFERSRAKAKVTVVFVFEKKNIVVALVPSFII